MVKAVLDLVPHCHSWADGELLGSYLGLALKNGGVVTLSFAGVDDVPSSFVNAAFVQLLNDFSYDDLRRRLSIVDSTRQINEMIKGRLEYEANRVLQCA